MTTQGHKELIFRPVLLDVRRYESVGSTMDVALEAVRAGALEGTVIVADEQTMGRGRRGRSWSSPPGAGLYVSFVLRPPVDAIPNRLLPILTLAAGIAVRSAIIGVTGLAPELKWPNDLMVGRRKLAGLLAEAVDLGTPAQSVILGVGINTCRATHPADVAARVTSLEDELGRTVDKEQLLESLLMAVPARYDELCVGNIDAILRAWREAAPSAQGRPVEWNTNEGTKAGITAGVDDTGALLVQTASGINRVVAGDVRWV